MLGYADRKRDKEQMSLLIDCGMIESKKSVWRQEHAKCEQAKLMDAAYSGDAVWTIGCNRQIYHLFCSGDYLGTYPLLQCCAAAFAFAASSDAKGAMPAGRSTAFSGRTCVSSTLD